MARSKKTYISSKKRMPLYRSRRFMLVLLIAVIALALFFTQRSNDTNDNAQNQTTSPTANNKGGQPASSGQGAGTDKSAGGSNTTLPSGEGPKTPYGSFVSSHSAQLNSPELSTCLSSVGAKCKISFSKDSLTKTLDEKTTDSDGAAYWSWRPQDLGLTAGSWKITAEASLNGKTASTADSRNLEIEP